MPANNIIVLNEIERTAFENFQLKYKLIVSKQETLQAQANMLKAQMEMLKCQMSLLEREFNDLEASKEKLKKEVKEKIVKLQEYSDFDLASANLTEKGIVISPPA